MEDKIFLAFIAGAVFEWFCNIMVEPIRRRDRRKCNYDCSKCRVWDCDRHLCMDQRNKDIRKGKINI